MNKTIVTYETHHGSAKRVAMEIANNLECDYIDIDTPYEVENLEEYDNIVIVFGFRGPYTAQLTKLYLNRAKEQYKGKNVFLVGEGLFSEKEFPIVAGEIHKMLECQTFNEYFIKGELRVDTLTKEEKNLLDEFSRITGMEIKDMGELNISEATKISDDIKKVISDNPVKEVEKKDEEEISWVCPMCGYVHIGPNPPEVCPICGAPGSIFTKK